MIRTRYFIMNTYTDVASEVQAQNITQKFNDVVVLMHLLLVYLKRKVLLKPEVYYKTTIQTGLIKKYMTRNLILRLFFAPVVSLRNLCVNHESEMSRNMTKPTN